MKTTTATQLRKDIFRSLGQVLDGEPLRIRTRRGNIIALSELLWQKQRGPRREPPPLQAKIPGRIVEALEIADDALRKHLAWPGKE